MNAVDGASADAGRSAGHLASWLEAARPRQWLKNGLVAAAPVAGLRFGSEALGRLAVAVLVMTVASAGNYFLNDAVDATADRNHPTKRRRPVASGRIGATASAIAGIAAILGATVACWFLLGGGCAVLVGGYGVLAASYSLLLKRVAYVDIAVIACGFVVRVVLGGVATAASMSAWFVAAWGAAAMTVAAGKRRSEVAALGVDASTHRRALNRYSPPLTGTLLLIGAGCFVLALAGWTVGGAGVGWEDGGDGVLVALAVLGISRFVQLAWVGHAAEPEALVTDPLLVVAAVAAVGLYLVGPLLT
jgi:decaprenyl-phosphate phosphoribosyltransferase